MTKIFGKYMEKSSKPMSKLMPKSMQHEGDSGIFVFLFFAESITLKSFFYMIGVTEILQKSIEKLGKIRYRKIWAQSMPKASKTEARIR